VTLAALLLALVMQATPLASPAPSTSPLAASASAVNLAPGQSETVTLTNVTGNVTASVDQPIVSTTADQNAHAVTVTAAQQTGRATLTITDQSGTSLTIPVRVAFPAATVPAALTLRVTGNPVDPAWLQRQVQRMLNNSIALQQGVPPQSAQIATYTLPPALGPGAEAVMPVSVHVAGGDRYLDVAATTDITLQNVALDPFAPPLLLYDDDPEKVNANGVLYRAQVNPGTPARLYYYHQNYGDMRRLLVLLTPAGQQSSIVQLIDASAGPNIDVMSVGHAATRDFLILKPRNEGIVEELQAGSPLTEDDFPGMRPLDGAAGTVGVRIVSGGPVTLTVLAVPDTAAPADVASYVDAAKLPGDGHHRTGVFDIRSFGQTALTYSVGGDDASIQYGASTPPAAGAAVGGHDYGEYGVLRSLTFTVTNPGAGAATLYLYERPLGGVVRSSFLVNGQLVEVGCARVSNRYQIGQPLSVTPGTSQVVLQTMTDGGSNYPLEVGITATPPQLATPPMSAPDGCFPKPQPGASPVPTPTPLTSPHPEVTGTTALPQ
jgi:hypothetical protein